MSHYDFMYEENTCNECGKTGLDGVQSSFINHYDVERVPSIAKHENKHLCKDCYTKLSYKDRVEQCKTFRIGIDPIPDWASKKITNNEIILMSFSNGTHGPFEHMNDTFCEILSVEEKTIIVCEHGVYVGLDSYGKAVKIK